MCDVELKRYGLQQKMSEHGDASPYPTPHLAKFRAICENKTLIPVGGKELILVRKLLLFCHRGMSLVQTEFAPGKIDLGAVLVTTKSVRDASAVFVPATGKSDNMDWDFFKKVLSSATSTVVKRYSISIFELSILFYSISRPINFNDHRLLRQSLRSPPIPRRSRATRPACASSVRPAYTASAAPSPRPQ